MPPIRSERVGLSSRLSRLLPCAVPMSCTPRSAIVRAAAASSSVPISSMTMTWGMWFSTASIITACWSDGRAHLHAARPSDAGCGMSPSPAISFDVSTMTTRLPRSSASTRAHSRSIVVLPIPGGPSSRIDFPLIDEVVDDLDRAVDGPADAAGQADDLARAVADGADAVERPLDAGAVVVAERPDVLDDVVDVGVADARRVEDRPRCREARLRHAAEVEHDLDQIARSAAAALDRRRDRAAGAPRSSRSSSSSPRGSVRHHLGDDLCLLDVGGAEHTGAGPIGVEGPAVLRAIPHGRGPASCARDGAWIRTLEPSSLISSSCVPDRRNRAAAGARISSEL